MRGVVVLGVLCAVLLGGCYGSTEPVTNIRPDSVQLNARGTANDGPAYTFFRVQEFGVPLPPPVDTPTRQWPAGASGPFSEKLTGLKRATNYFVRLCGADVGDQPVCANSRDFATRGPDGEDSVLGGWLVRTTGADPSGGGVSAHSDPSGANPRGSLRITRVVVGDTYELHVFTGFVSCLRVEGNHAVVGAVGLDRNENTETDQPFTAKLSVTDHGPSDSFSQVFEPGSTAPDCGEDLDAGFGVALTSVVVTDNAD